MDALSIAVGTVTMRPYVFAFFAAYLVAAVTHLGWKKTLYFTGIGYMISFLSEVCSINTGFPYGWYYYVDATRGQELWILGVPFFDSLSYVFLAYCSYSTALFVISPIRACRRDLVTLETRAIRGSYSVLLLGALFQVFLDIIIDPVALQGHRWFLGGIYGYREPGIHFGVPLSNYAGWFLVSAIMILALQKIDACVDIKDVKPKGVSSLPFRSLFGPILYLSVIIFNLTITMVIGERLMAMTGIFIYTLPTVIAIVLIVRRVNKYTKEESSQHLADYPYLSSQKGQELSRTILGKAI